MGLQIFVQRRDPLRRPFGLGSWVSVILRVFLAPAPVPRFAFGILLLATVGFSSGPPRADFCSGLLRYLDSLLVSCCFRFFLGRCSSGQEQWLPGRKNSRQLGQYLISTPFLTNRSWAQICSFAFFSFLSFPFSFLFSASLPSHFSLPFPPSSVSSPSCGPIRKQSGPCPHSFPFQFEKVRRQPLQYLAPTCSSPK